MGEFPSMIDFQKSVGTQFTICSGGLASGSLELDTLEVKTSSSIQESFSLVFRAPNEIPPVQQQFTLRHAQLGTHTLFLVPFRQDANGVYFEAVFNRLLR